MQLKSLVASLLLRTWQPVTDIAFAISAPERLRRLTGCYAASIGNAVVRRGADHPRPCRPFGERHRYDETSTLLARVSEVQAFQFHQKVRVLFL